MQTEDKRMTPFPARRARALARAVLLAAAVAVAASAPAATTVDLADKPLFSTVSVPGNLALALSVEWPTATTPAYPSTTSYSAAATFLGYFDPAKCYAYVAVNGGTAASPDYSASYFAPNGAATSHACTSTASQPLWSGNYLNWASMQTLDAFRWVLTGGYRSVDTSSSTILTKTYAAQDSGAMPQKTVAASTSTSILSGATPFTDGAWTSGVTTRLRKLGTRMWITSSSTGSSSLVVGSQTSGATAYTGQNSYVASNDSNYADPTKTYEVYINVKVCDASVGVESNCTAYGSNYKPEGLMQKYASQLRYSAFGYYNHSGDTTQQRDGGVMRARMKYIGPTQPVPGSTAITNSLAEWNSSTGVMTTNPDATDASATQDFASAAGWSVSITNSGVMNYLNKFGYSAKSYKSKDPVSELYYAVLRYFRNLGNVSSYTTLAGAGSPATAAQWLDGFPAITTWDDPIAYTCQKNFVLGIGDVNTHRDANLPGSTLRALSSLEPALPSEVASDTTVNVATATNMVGTLEGYAGLGSVFGDSGGTTCASTGTECDSYYIAGLAYDAHTNDIRSDLAGTQTVNTYWMDVEENQIYKHKNQYWLAAKYGGFDVPTGFSPYASTNGTSTIPTSAWYTTSDTLARSSGASGELVYSTDTSRTTADKRPDNYFPGNQPDAMQSGLTKAFAKISSEAAAANSTSLVLPSPNSTSATAVSYSATYDPTTWTGDVKASAVTFASDGSTSQALAWDARSLLSAGAVTASTRRIVTCCLSSGGPGLPFTASALSTGPLDARTNYTSFGSVPGVSSSSQSAANYVAYLRGDTSQEVGNGGVYRKRSFRLGDIVNAKPVAVAAPQFPYYDLYNAGYSSFKTTYAGRKAVVYAGANDGMLHAFDGTVGSAGSGAELFAYVPSFVYGSSGTASTSGLASLGNPSFTHHYFVDSTPVMADVDLAKTYGATDAGNAWRTLLIGGLGKGGTGYYALDVTDPSSWTSETAVAGKVLWEFADARMGYSFGQASVVKTKKYGWVVVVSSGYNNGDGVGYFFFVNPKSGALLEAVATPAGSASAPVNLGPVVGFVPDYTDGTADALYAGDMQGNVWRLDVTGASGAYAAPVLIATLANASSAAQPVTTKVLPEIDPTSNKRYVLVGTGRLLADSDISSGSQQSFYALVDGTSSAGGFYTAATLPTGVTFPLTRQQLNADTDLTAGIGSSPASAMGWYYDLPVTNNIAQRMNIDPAAAQGVVTFAGNLPNGQVCSPSGTGTVYAVSFATGKTVLVKTTTNADNTVTTTRGASTADTSGIITEVDILNVAGSLKLVYGDSASNVVNPPANLSTSAGVKQLNWRDVPPTN
jgi:type IV pilus assembly protein PilY1